MSFKPKEDGAQQNSGGFKRDPNFKWPEPKTGNRPGRVSLIVELGNQKRDPFKDPKTGEEKELAPKDQVAIFADLTNDVVDYGGEIGEQPYRLMLNSSFLGKVSGTTFGSVHPDMSATTGVWTFHSNSVLTKLARATGTEEIIQEGPDKNDISLLLGKAAMFEVAIKKTESKDQKDEEGNPIVYTNVRFKGCSSLPEMPDGSAYPVPEMSIEPMTITFDDATVEQVKFLRKDVRETIKQALNYEGSQIQAAIEEFENKRSQSSNSNRDSQPADNANNTPGFDDFDDDVPF